MWFIGRGFGETSEEVLLCAQTVGEGLVVAGVVCRTRSKLR